MRRKDIVKIERTLTRLQDGDLYTPVEVSGIGEYHAISRRLEALRLSILKVKDEQEETLKRASLSISSVAHDMKTPLSIISGYAECMSDGLDDKDYPALILQKSTQMNDMVVSMVEMSRQEMNKAKTHRVLCNARCLFGRIMQKQHAIADTKRIKLIVGKIPDVNIRADESQMESVMQNLVSNAVKYSPEKSTIKVSFKRIGDNLHICVKDQGIGIAKVNLPFVFDQYYKEDKSRPSGASQGVGLYVVKRIVDDYGGKVFARSKKGDGSSFYVQIPIEKNIDNASFTTKFDRCPLWQKTIIMFLFGWAWTWIYRIIKFFETKYVSTFVAGILAIALFVFVWPIDYISILVYGKMTFLAD